MLLPLCIEVSFDYIFLYYIIFPESWYMRLRLGAIAGIQQTSQDYRNRHAFACLSRLLHSDCLRCVRLSQ